MLVESELEEDGERHLLTDDEIYGFARLILTAGSGTTWRQLGILLVALLRDQVLLDAVREDRELRGVVVAEALDRRARAHAIAARRLACVDVTVGAHRVGRSVAEVSGVRVDHRVGGRWLAPAPAVAARDDERSDDGHGGGLYLARSLQMSLSYSLQPAAPSSNRKP